MTLNRSSLTFVATLLVAGLLVFWVISKSERQAAQGATAVVWQQADAPPEDDGQAPDPRLDPPSAWLDALAPLVDGIGPAVDGEAVPGAPVVASADGVVLFAGVRGGQFEVRLGHRDEAGFKFESTYAPLAAVAVRRGGLVGRGMPVGTHGESQLAPIFSELPDGLPRLDAGRSALADAMETPDPDPWMWLEMQNAGRFLELMNQEDED